MSEKIVMTEPQEVGDTTTFTTDTGFEVAITKTKNGQGGYSDSSLKKSSQNYDLSKAPVSVTKVENIVRDLVFWKSPLASSMVYIGLTVGAYALTSYHYLHYIYFLTGLAIGALVGTRIGLNFLVEWVGIQLNLDAPIEQAAKSGILSKSRMEKIAGDVADMMNWWYGRTLLMAFRQPGRVAMILPPLMFAYYFRITFFWSFVLTATSLFFGPMTYILIIEHFGDKVDGIENQLRNAYDVGVQKTRELSAKLHEKIQTLAPTKVKKERFKNEE